MSNQTSLLDQISSTQAQKEVLANALLDAASPAMIWGRHASTTSGLTWGYYGGTYQVGGTANAVANGTLTLTASATNYIYANALTGAVGFNTTGFPAGAIPLYVATTGTSTVTNYTDQRSYQPSGTVAVAAAHDNAGFVDGNFDSWQVGTSFTLAAATDTYTADMWVCNAGTGGAATVSQQTAALGAEPSYMIRPRKYQLSYAQTTAATTSPTIGQKLEGVSQYNGQTITVSASLAAAAAGTDVVGIQVTQNFGTGGSPSASVVTTQAVSWALTTSEQNFSAQIAVPSISGKTLGTGGNDYVRVDLLLATGSTYTVYASQLQIDVGNVALPFRFRGLSAEFSRVFRYVQYLTGLYPMGAFISATAAFSGTAIPQMRATPACSATSTFAAVVQVPGSTAQTATTKAAIGESPVTVVVELGGVSGTVAGTAILQNTAGGFILDARL